MARTVPENMDTEDVDVIVIDSDSDCVIVNDSDIEQEQKKLCEIEKHKNHGDMLAKNGKYIEAIQMYTEGINLEPNNIITAKCYANRSACYMNLQKYDDALNDSNVAALYDTSYTKGPVRALKCKTLLGDFKAARQIVADTIEPCAQFAVEKVNLDQIEFDYALAMKAYEKEQHREAVFYLDKVIKAGVVAPCFKTKKAVCLALHGLYKEAELLANSVLALDKMNVDAIFARALCIYYQQDIDTAFNEFQRILKLDPDYKKVVPLYKKCRLIKIKKEEGNAAFQKKNYEAALKLYTEALEVDSKVVNTNAKLHVNRAIVLSKLDRHEEAVGDCTSALNLDATYIKALLRRAQCYSALQNYEEAVNDYEAVVKISDSKEYNRLLLEAKIELKKSKRKDYYKILGVSRSASIDEIRRAYLKKAKIHHPDRHVDAPESVQKEQERLFKESGEANTILSDPKKKHAYDSGRDIDMDGRSNFSNFSECPSFNGFGGYAFQFAYN